MALHGQEILGVEKGGGLRHEKEADIKDITKVQLKGLGGWLDVGEAATPWDMYMFTRVGLVDF